MYPGSFIWNHIEDEWLESKTASRLSATATVVIVYMTLVCAADVWYRELGPIENVLLGIGVVVGAFSAFFLWGGMWRHWKCGELPPFAMRRFWFIMLTVGLWYGAILYYFVIYLRARRLKGNTI